MNDETLDQLADMILERVMAKLAPQMSVTPPDSDTGWDGLADEFGGESVAPAAQPTPPVPVERPEPTVEVGPPPQMKDPIGATPTVIAVGGSSGAQLSEQRIMADYRKHFQGAFKVAGVPQGVVAANPWAVD